MMNQQISATIRGAFFFFLLACAVVVGYDVTYVWPAKQCEATGDWWDSKDRQCLTPIPIWRVTGRHLPRGGEQAAKTPTVKSPTPPGPSAAP